MKSRVTGFNIYLLALLLAAGCSSLDSDKKIKPPREHGKEATRISFHVEMSPTDTEHVVQVPIFRASPTMLSVSRSPVLHEGYIAHAAVVESQGVFEIRIEFDHTGLMLLDNISSSYRGHHLAVFSEFGDNRWLAAPLLDHRITDGVFTFAPDATRAEAERIVRGLNNVAKEWQTKKNE